MEQPTKASLRAQARQILAGLSTDARAAASSEIRRRIQSLPAWATARTIALYAAQSTEPDLSSLLVAPGKIFCLPRVSGGGLEFHRCHSKDLLLPSRWNLLEPDPARCPIIPPSEIDLLLIPGLLFARTGARLGRGGGFYDRFLSRIHPRALKIGICFQAQLVPVLPIETHDHEVNLVVTEMETLRSEV